MKSARIIFFALILLAMLASVMACIGGGGGGGGGGNGTPQPILGDDVTATYGAELFHQQLTAIARDQVTPAAQQP